MNKPHILITTAKAHYPAMSGTEIRANPSNFKTTGGHPNKSTTPSHAGAEAPSHAGAEARIHTRDPAITELFFINGGNDSLTEYVVQASSARQSIVERSSDDAPNPQTGAATRASAQNTFNVTATPAMGSGRRVNRIQFFKFISL